MALYSKMPFPPHQGIPFDYAPPLVDGFVEPNNGVATTQLEPGYTSGPRFAFGGESGVPMVVFQGIRHSSQNLIYMGFLARFDPGFDGKDFVSIFLQPAPGAPSAADRRIDVFPNLAIPGAPPGQTTSAGAPAVPADPAGNDRIGMGFPEIRTNKPPNVMNLYKRTPGGADKWGPTAEPAGMDCKVRSENDGANRFWSVEVVFPSVNPGGGDWITLGSTFGLYFNVGVGWVDSAGINYVVQYPWPYDPNNPSSTFLADPAGFSVTPENWDPPSYGQGLIGDLSSAQGITFVGDALGIGVLGAGSTIGGSVDMKNLGAHNMMVARLQNSSTNTAPKVRARFRIAEFGIGGAYSGGAAWENIADPTTNPAPHAGVDVPTTPVGGHQDVTLDWVCDSAWQAKFTGRSSDQCLWVQLDTVAAVPAPPAGPAPAGPAVEFVQNSMRRNLWVTHLSTVAHKAALDASHLDLQHLIRDTHQVILQVASTPVKPPAQTPAELALAEVGIRHVSPIGGLQLRAAAAPRMAVTAATRMATPAAGVAARDVTVPILFENPILTGAIGRAAIARPDNPRIPPRRVATWFSAVNAYQVLGGRTLTYANGEKARIAAFVGSYGYLAQHYVRLTESIDTLDLNHQLTGANLKSLGNNLYQGTVAPQAKVELVNTLKTKQIPRFPGPLGILTKPVNVVSKPISAFGDLVSRFRVGG